MTGPSAKLPTRSFGPCRSTRMPIGRPCSASTARIERHQLAHAVVRGVTHVDAEDVGAGSNRRAIVASVGGGRAERRDDLGPALTSHQFVLREGGAGVPGRPAAGGVCSIGTRDCRGCIGACIGRFGELDRPDLLLAGVDLEEAGAVVAAREAILGAADGEFLVARAHEGLARPFAAAVVVDRVDVIEARHQRAAQHGFAAAGGQVPPALGAPAVIRPCSRPRRRRAAGVVAKAEIGQRPIGDQHDRIASSAAHTNPRARARRGRSVGRQTPAVVEPSVISRPHPRPEGPNTPGYRVNPYGLSTRIARKSLTLV